MKASRIFLNLSIALPVCISCVREPKAGHTDVRDISISVSVDSGHAVRGTSSENEEAVNGVQIVLFRDGILYASASFDDRTAELKVSKGKYSMYAFVNDPSDWISRPDLTEDMIMKSFSPYSDNSLSSFVMFGHVPEIVVGEKDVTETIYVDRLMSRISLEEITVDFSSNPYYKGCSLMVRNIYLINVLGTCPYSMKPSSSPSSSDVWYNRMGPESCPSSIAAMTSDKGLETAIRDGSSGSFGKVYYAYPNGCVSDSDSDTWNARRCRLAIEAVLDGKECWYHITLPPMKPNASYIISNCTIKNIGGRSPEDNSWPSCEAVITESLDWDQTFTVEEES